MEFRLLGPLEVRDDRGEVVALPRRLQRALLAALLLRAGTVVSTDRLVDQLWGEQPPPSALGSLQNTVSQLRRLLGADVLRTQPPGYVLDVPVAAVDAGRFEQLLGEAASLEETARAAALREALALWRGPALADLADEDWAQTEANRLDELRLTAIEDRIEAELALARHAPLVAQLEALVAEQPLRERLWRQLALALYRSGRQADALEACRSARNALDELGLEPSPELRQLERDILRQSAGLAAPEAPEEEVQEAVAGERRIVSVLAADVPEEEDPEALRATLARVLEAATAAVGRHGGTIERFGPEGLTAVFGADASHEDDALRAVRAAAELHGAAGIPVGVATGEAIVADEPYVTGSVTAQAAALARSGTGVRLDRRTHELVRGSASVPGDAPLVGREAELARLREAFAAASAERRCVSLVVVGEAGIGKSRLARALAGAVDATVLQGRCAAYGEGATFVPMAEALADVDAAEVVDATVAKRIEELRGGAPEPASLGESYWAVRRVLEALADRKPVLLLLDDVHWAEPALLDLVEYLAARVTAAPLLVLCLARPELLEQRPGWAADALRLDPLTDEEAREIVGRTAPGLDEDAREQIVSLAEGNALYAQQLAALAAESGKALEPGAMPATLEAVLAGRLGRLEAGERATLQRAAVVGREFSRGAVAALAPPDLAVDAHLLALARRGFVHAAVDSPPGDDAYRFHHVLLRDAAYATLTKEQRAELHERVAEWLDRDGEGEDAMVGYHLEQASQCLADVGRASEELASSAGERLGRAGVRASARGDSRAAAGLLSRAAKLLPSSLQRAELSCELAIALQAVGRHREAADALRQAFDDARQHGNAKLEARSTLEAAYLRLGQGTEQSPERLLEIAAEVRPVLEESGDDRALGRLWLAVCAAENYRLRYAETAMAGERALHHHRRAGFSRVGGWLAVAYYYGPTPVEEAIRRCTELMTRADALALQTVIAGLHAFAGRFDEARDLSASALARMLDLGMETAVALTWSQIRMEIERLAGDGDAAVSTGRESMERLIELGLSDHAATRAAHLASVLLQRDRPGEAAELVEYARRSAPAYDVLTRAWAASVEARLLARDRSSVARARELAREATELLAPTDALTDRANLELALAEVELMTGRPARARAAAERAEKIFRRKGHSAGAALAAALAAQPVAG